MIGMFLDYLLISTFILGACFALALWNLRLFGMRPRKISPIGELPMVSVLVPARNEEQTIERCLRSLLAQDYPAFEVIVLDDSSTDRTAEILERLQRAEPARLRVLKGRPLEAGWIGKNFACHQLSEQARGSWLLFVDADTVHKPGGLSAGLALALHHRADLLTLIPEEKMETFGEKLILPLLHFTTFAFLPFYAVEHCSSPLFAVGVGQYMLFRTEAYRAIGGHASVRNNIIEDIWLARGIKRHGFRLAAADGMPIVSCRMYRSFKDVWNGFSKNIFAGFNFSLAAMPPSLLLYAALFAVPFILLCAGIATGSLDRGETELLMLQIALNYMMRAVLSVRFRLGVLSTLLHPLGILSVIAIALNSWRWVAFGGGSRWKGRTYQQSTMDGPM